MLFKKGLFSSSTSSSNSYFKGYFANQAALEAAYPTAIAGDYAIVGSTDTIWVWDTGTSAWINTDNSGVVTSVFGRIGAVLAEAQDYNAEQIATTQGALVLAQATTVTAPAAGKNSIYFKSDDNAYIKSAGDVEEQLITKEGFDYLQNKSIDGDENNLTNIANASLVNSAITINGTSVSLGGSISISTGTTTNALTVGTGLQYNSGTTFNGSAARTISIDTSVVVTLSASQLLSNKFLQEPAIDLITDNLISPVLAFDSVAIGVNYFQMRAGTAGNAATLSVVGSDTNINSNFVSKGTGKVQANGVEVATISTAQSLSSKSLVSPKIVNGLYDENGNLMLEFVKAASAVNYIQILNGATGNSVQFIAAGADSVIDVDIAGKGAGSFTSGGDLVVLASASQTIINKGIDGDDNTLTNIPNSALVYDYIAVNGTVFNLGESNTITANTSNPLTVSTGLQLNSGTTFDGSLARTISIDSSVVRTSGAQTLTDKILTTPVIDAVVDVSANTILGFTSVATPANFPVIYNSAAGSPVKIRAVGADTHVGFDVDTQSAGAFTVNSLPVEYCLASVSGVDVNTSSKTNIFTVAAGKNVCITRMNIRGALTSLTVAEISGGYDANASDVFDNTPLADLTTSNRGLPFIAKGGYIVGTGGDVFGVKANTLQGSAATVVVEIFGYYV